MLKNSAYTSHTTCTSILQAAQFISLDLCTPASLTAPMTSFLSPPPHLQFLASPDDTNNGTGHCDRPREGDHRGRGSAFPHDSIPVIRLKTHHGHLL